MLEGVDRHAQSLAGGLPGHVVLAERRCLAGRCLDAGFAERTLQIVQAVLAGTQRTLQHLIDELAECFRRVGSCCLRLRFGGFGQCARQALQLIDQIEVIAFRLALFALDGRENFLDAVDGLQDQRDRVRRGGGAVAELAHDVLGRMGERFKAREIQKAARAFDRMHKAENAVENLLVARFLLEPHKLIVDDVETLIGLGHKLTQQIVHKTPLRTEYAPSSRRFLSVNNVTGNGLILVAWRHGRTPH